MLLVIDNYDSFTYNLVQYLGELDADPRVWRNDEITIAKIKRLKPRQIVISPGPCTPKEAGISNDVIRTFSGRIPILGVCLGHQCLGYAFGGRIIRAANIMHGKTSKIFHDKNVLFSGIPNPFIATRYHSLLVDKATLPKVLEIIAWTKEREIMGLAHTAHPTWGVQFHPESIMTDAGMRLLKNFLMASKKLTGMRPRSEKNGFLIRSILSGLLTGRDMTAQNAARVFEMLFSGRLKMPQAKAFLLLLAAKGETPDELWAAANALRKFEKPIGPKIPGLMDTCGTGGDKSQSINISTITAFVVAGAGGKVAKHGNRAISSRSGSSDLMEALGVPLDAPVSQMFKAIKEAGIGYFHAPFYHPAFARLQPLRTALKRRTILNLIGPLVNPMRLDHQLVGVSEKRLLLLYARTLARLGRKSALVCHSADGLDEISTAAPTHTAWIKRGRVMMGKIHPKGLGLRSIAKKDLRVTGPHQSHGIARKILSGKEKGPQRDVVILNAACALWLNGKAGSLKEGIRSATRSLDSGKAWGALMKLKRIAMGRL